MQTQTEAWGGLYSLRTSSTSSRPYPYPRSYHVVDSSQEALYRTVSVLSILYQLTVFIGFVAFRSHSDMPLTPVSLRYSVSRSTRCSPVVNALLMPLPDDSVPRYLSKSPSQLRAFIQLLYRLEHHSNACPRVRGPFSYMTCSAILHPFQM